MASYRYKARTPDGEAKDGKIEAPSLEIAVASLQRIGLIIISVEPDESDLPWYQKAINITSGVKNRDIVILSRQLATLFEARVPVVSSLKVLEGESTNPALRKHIHELLADIQGGLSMSQAMSRHPQVFSDFYVNMVRSGEEAGKLQEIFSYLADYLDRSYELQTKVRNALIYPAFVFTVFILVMTLMLVVVIPRLTDILQESGQAIPIYTKIVIGISDILRNFGVFILILLAVGGIFLWRYLQKPAGKAALSRFVIELPLFGDLFRKLYLSRLADNLNTLLSGGVSVLRALEITSDVIGNDVYASIVRHSMDDIKGGSSISEALSKFEEIPSLFSQMIKVGEETGKLDYILKTLSNFYRREVNNVIDNLVTLIEPLMIIMLGLGVGILVAAVLLPIYNLSSGI